MCGIIAGLATTNIESILLAGLARLEYRGYDSAGIVVDDGKQLNRHRAVGKVAKLQSVCTEKPLLGQLGLAHTRWATHGKPTIANAHPHICNQRFALVHNGIIENYHQLQKQQSNFHFSSDTDTEVLVHQIEVNYPKGEQLLTAVQKTIGQIEGAYAFAVIEQGSQQLIATRCGSPLVLAMGKRGVFVASDVTALLTVADSFVFLEDGDMVVADQLGYQIYDEAGHAIERTPVKNDLELTQLSKQGYKHFMLKEIFEQPNAIAQTLLGRVDENGISQTLLGENTQAILAKIKQIQIIACGTSYHAGLVAKYWLEDLADIPCAVEVASEYRYRNPVLLDDTLVILISQSGETADTLAALKSIKKQNKKVVSLAICNVAQSSLTRLADVSFLTKAGIEIGVASTKAFTTQLVALMLLAIALMETKKIKQKTIDYLLANLMQLPNLIANVLTVAKQIEQLAVKFANKDNALFLGRGLEYPVALEGALKLKEISYIHAEAYPAGELKHGPLALVDALIPVIAVAPNNSLLKKLKANIREVQARGGELFVFADSAVYEKAEIVDNQYFHLIDIAKVDAIFAPIVFTVPLQLLAYYVAIIKGTDVDQPRNLAKAVTVE